MDMDEGTGPVWQRDRILERWKESMEYAQGTLLSSSTKRRVTFLQDELLPLVKHADLSLENATDIFNLLASTYSRYSDSQSRDAVEEIIRDMVRADELRGVQEGKKLGISDRILEWLSNEAGRMAKRLPDAYASSDLFVLLSWSCGTFTTYVQANPGFGADTNAAAWKTSIMTIATLFDMLSASVKRPAILTGALVRVRRALRSAGLDKLQVVINTLLLQLKTTSTPLRIFPLLGVSIAVLIRLKHVDVEPTARLPDNARGEVLKAYSSNVLISKTAVPPHVSTSLEDFIKNFISQGDVAQTIVPTLEKAILRSPENSLPVITDFFTAYTGVLDAETMKRVVTQAVNTSKSTNAVIRNNSILLFKSVISRSSEELAAVALTELLSLPQAGKSAGPDHRIALYSMAALIKPSTETSAAAEGEKSLSYSFIKSATTLLSKENHEGSAATLAGALPPHIAAVLRGGLGVPTETTTLIVKEMGSAKHPVKRAFCALVGSAFFGDIGSQEQADWVEKPKVLEFAKAIVPGLEKSLAAVSANPINSPAGPLEGYIAIAVLLGPLAKTGAFADVISKNAVLSSFVGTPTKPFFLLWDKVYSKVSNSLDELWLLRASVKALIHYKPELNKNESLRSQLGLIFVHLALEASTPALRADLYKSIQELAKIEPNLVNRVIREGTAAFLLRHASSSKTPAPLASLDEAAPQKPFSKHVQLSTLLGSAVSFKTAEDGESGITLEKREEMAVEMLILAHHRMICGTSKQTWIDLCQKAGADPRELTERNADRLMKLVLEASTVDSAGFVDASQSAVGTLVFVAPETILSRILEQIRLDLDSQQISNLTEDDLGIWRTPEGKTYVDVLGTNKDKNIGKGKDQDIAKWEAEVRKSIASKKGGSSTPATLTKQQQALVNAQLEAEAKVRMKVVGLVASMRRGMGFIRALTSSGAEAIQSEIGSMAKLLSQSVLSQTGTALIGDEGYETYLKLADCTSERLDTIRKWVGIASLRSLNVAAIPEELQAEPLQLLVIRVLYRLQTLSDQATLDVATFSYAYPLLSEVLIQGGISASDDEETLEQIMLTITIIRSHAGEFSNLAYPRIAAMQDLLHIIKQQPRLAKEASSTLVDVGEAVQAAATEEELNILLRGTLAQETTVRSSCLQTLQPFDLTDLDWSLELLLACHDDDEQNSRLARHLWDDNGLDVPENAVDSLLDYLDHENAYVRTATAAAITEAVDRWPQIAHGTVLALQEHYREKSKLLAPEFDQYGMVIAQTLDRADPWPARSAISTTLQLLSPAFTDEDIGPFFTFLIKDEALGDREGEVRRGMLQAGTSVIDAHGARHITALITVFEDHLRQPSPSTETGDYIKEAVIILFGRVARHLDSTDSRIPSIIERLVEALKTPSEQVQIAVSDCISPLVKLIRPTTSELVDGLFTDLLEGPKYAVRRGAAYGLAGVLKGTGIPGIKEFNVINRLRVAAEDKKKSEARQGVMFAFETLSNALGRLFEPYITYLLPLLLAMFGDASTDVREATQDAAKVIMSNLSGYGVKLILPSLLEGLDEKQWRTKKGSIELLGMMAYCSPRQLSVSLPIVIPRLTGVLTDSHAQVRTAANKSLKQFGEVISNPEIQNLVPVLLKALVDPAKTPSALTSLLKTSFMHYIDHSSLALVIPIIERGLRERGADVKKKAVQIVGNLASLTDSKDFIPYMSELLPLVHTVLVDPVPEARATAAKALGTLVERLGEVHFPDLVPGLLRTLKTDTSGVDRQGAAQGLSEVLSGLGMERLEGLLPDILANAQSPRATVREGFMSLLVYLPATFGTRFQPHLPKIITPILSGLSDIEEYVREAAMKAGRMVVTNYSTKAIDLLLPELERGMFDSGWRIRQSSVTLVGELLFKVSGISGKTDDLDEEGGEDEAEAAAATESSKKALLDVLGQERRDRVLAALYLVRQDGVAVVRQTSIQIWKALVQNTPRTVREVLPELINQIIYLVSGDEFEQQETATRTTGELCRKFGERLVGELMPLVKEKATSSDPRTRQGVCQVVSDVMENTTDTQRENHEDDIISIVRVSLVDDEPNVRSAAAQAFDILQEHIGNKAIDQTIPTLLEALRQPGKGSGTALHALREVMSVRASTVFPVLIPTLTATPMTVFNCRALSSLVTVAGNALSRRLTVILNSLVKSIEDDKREELQEALGETLRSLLSSISDAEGLNTLMLILLGWAKHDNPRRRVSACKFFSVFCEVSEMDASLYRIDWIRQLVSSLEDSQVEVHTAAWEALDVFVKSVPKDEYEPLVVPLRRSIESTGGPGHIVPGFSLPKGVSPFVPIIIAGLTTGSNEQREQAAYAIGDLVERTDESSIKPFVVPFTGPLIRVATQATAYPPGVKTAILSALMSMLERIPIFVKPFFPQLQRTFVKSASDPSSTNVRNKAAQALGVLMRHQPRVDPVITELITGVKSSDDATGSSLVAALANVVKNASSNIGEKARESCAELLAEVFRESHGDHFCAAVGSLMVAMSDHPELLDSIVKTHLTAGTEQTTMSIQVILTVITNDDDEDYTGPNLFQKLGALRSVAQKVKEGITSDKPSVARASREARDILKALDDETLEGAL